MEDDSYKMKDPTPQEIINVLKHLTGIWKQDAQIKYILDRYQELEEYLL